MAFQAIQPNLALNQKGADVTYLQAALEQIDFGSPITPQERSERFFGDGTADAVGRLQSQYGLSTTPLGTVDEQTADLINQLLFRSGVFRSIKGRVTNQAGNAVAGNLLFAFDKDNIGGAYLGTAYTKPDGTYQIFYDPLFYSDPLVYSIPREGVLKTKDIIDLVVQVYDATGQTLAQSPPLPDPASEVEVNLLVADRPLGPSFVVRGQVLDASGPLNQVLVSVIDRDLFYGRPDAPAAQVLGSGLTGQRPSHEEEGWFEFSYTPTEFASGDQSVRGVVPTPDLLFALSRNGQPLEPMEIMRLADGQDILEDTLVSAEDRVLGLQARKQEEVRIRLQGGTARREPSEYELLIQAIEPLLPQQAPSNASAAEREALVQEAVRRFDEVKHRDVSFAARETGFARSSIEALVAAAGLAADPFLNALPIFVFYGLARTRAATDLLSLGRLSNAEVVAGLKQAANESAPIIPPLEPALDLDTVVATIRSVLEQQLPSLRPAEGEPSLADLVGWVLPSATDQGSLWAAMVDHEGTAEEFWDQLQQRPGFNQSNTVSKLQYAFDLSALARNNLSVIEAVRTSFPQVERLRDLAFELDTTEKWHRLLDNSSIPIQIPKDVPGKPEEQKENYAASLALAVQIAHPSVAIVNMVAALPNPVLGQAQSAIAGVLTTAIRDMDFDLVDGHIDEMLTQHGEHLLQGVPPGQHTEVIDQLKRLQRVFRLSTGIESMQVLLKAGFQSARELAELPSDMALEMLSPGMGEEAAALVLNRAQNITAMAIHQYVFLNEACNGVQPEVLHGIR